MSDLVPKSQIEATVGVKRSPDRHIGRAVSAEDRFYILHSENCLTKHPDLRDCPYSKALDRGVVWAPLDTPVLLAITNGQLVCVKEAS